MKILQEDTTPDPEALVSARAAPSSPERSRSTPAGKRYAGMKKMLIPVEEAMHRRLKALAAEQGKTLETTVQEACAAHIKSHAGV